jgi:hypothetical protein
MTTLREFLRLLREYGRPLGRDDDGVLRRDERDAAILSDKFPREDLERERASEVRLAQLMQYPHY